MALLFAIIHRTASTGLAELPSVKSSPRSCGKSLRGKVAECCVQAWGHLTGERGELPVRLLAQAASITPSPSVFLFHSDAVIPEFHSSEIKGSFLTAFEQDTACLR